MRRVIEGNYTRAKGILESNLDKLHTMAEALIKYETIDEDQLKDIMAGKTPKPPAGWDETLSNKPPKAPPAEGPAAGRPADPGRPALSRGAPLPQGRRVPKGRPPCRPRPSAALRRTTLDLSTPVVMGVLNVTPDSFSDGGRFLGLAAAIEQGCAWLARARPSSMSAASPPVPAPRR